VKIVGLRSYVLPAEWKEWVVILLETEDGLTGIGEATLDYRSAAVVGALEECAEFLIGKSAIGIERIWQELYRGFFWRGGAVQMTALSAIDQALWDIAGKAANLPVHRLLGGAVRDRIPVYLNQWYRGARSPEELVEKAVAAVAGGSRALKWYPFRFLPMGSQNYMLSSGEMRRAVGEVEAVRRAVGPDVALMVDLACRLDRTMTIQFCYAVEPCDLLFVEEPVGPENAAVLKEIARATRVRLATGERLFSRWDFREVIEQQMVGFVQPDVSHAGGITEMRKIAAMAETYMIGVAPHNPLGPVANAASLQVSATIPNFVLLEAYADDVPPMRQQFVVDGPWMDGDAFPIPEAPGLGITVDEAALRRLAVPATGHRATRAPMS
jgi:galactonate dehydratase